MQVSTAGAYREPNRRFAPESGHPGHDRDQMAEAARIRHARIASLTMSAAAAFYRTLSMAGSEHPDFQAICR
jgi:hypothetical protein